MRISSLSFRTWKEDHTENTGVIGLAAAAAATTIT
jgi:hypothetical protein